MGNAGEYGHPRQLNKSMHGWVWPGMALNPITPGKPAPLPHKGTHKATHKATHQLTHQLHLHLEQK